MERSLACAEIARSRLQSLDLPPTPRNYEIFYIYATQQDRALNKEIDDVVAGGGALTEAVLDRLRSTYFASVRIVERVERASSGIRMELGDVIKLIAGTLGATTIYGDMLAKASDDLTAADDPSLIQSTLHALVAATLDVREDGLQLKARLDGAMREISSLQQGLEAIRMESRTDALTGLANRKFLDETIRESICGSSERGEPLALLMIDIDHFKSFNDTFGHTTGDQVLRLVATSLKQGVAEQGFAARYGGEEFVIVLPNTLPRQAVIIADHIRRAVMAKELKKRSTGEVIGRITVSIGVASLLADDTVESFIERADSCLYSAKRGGRNRVAAVVDQRALRDTNLRVA